MSNTIIRLPKVQQMVGLSRASIYRHIAKGDFPATISLGDRAVGWLKSDIDQWLDERIAASKGVNNE